MSPTPRDPVRTITAATAFLALLIAITLPIGYFLSAERNLRTEADGQAELLPKSMSIRDALTGLFNRRYLTETLDRELARARRSNTSLAVIMLDVDHFKRFNDTFGHDGGDAVLRELGALLRPSVRADDIACRYGGEEFCLVLPQMDRDGARQRAETIRTAVARLEVKSDGRALGPVTLSLGVAVFPDHAEDQDGLLRCADEALYEAKKGGRNRTVISGAAAQAHELREAATTT